MTPRSSSSTSRASSPSCPSKRAAAGVALALLAAALFALACDGSSSAPDATAPEPTVTANPALVATAATDDLIDVQIGEALVRVETAVSAEERAQGLSDRASMPDDVGMLFVFEEERIPSFTMRRMHFPLDFIWISGDRRVVDLTEDVPNPDATGQEISGLQPTAAVLYVIEVNAGFIAEHGIAIGDEVSFAREPVQD